MSDVQPAELPDFRRMPLADAVRWLAENGEPADPRPDIDTASLKRRFPHLAAVEVADTRVDGPGGRIVPARLYRDTAAAASGRALVWVHGGAFIGGHLDMPESNWVALELAARGTPVLALDYVKCLGRTHFPEPSDDVLAGWAHALMHGEELFGLPASAIVLGGASAGGNLAAGAVARLRDAGEAVPAGLVLVYPLVHPNGPEASAEVDAASPHGQLALNFAGRADALRDPHAFAALGPVSGFPPTLVIVCEFDGLRPSGEAFARQLRASGIPVSVHVEAGADHGHINEPADPAAPRTIDAIAQWMGRCAPRRSAVVSGRSEMHQKTADLIRASLRGNVDVEVRPTGLTPLRLPLSARAQSDSDWMRIAAEQASGVRCEFRTAATWIELTVETTGLYLPWVPDHVRWAVFSATVDGQPTDDARVTGGSELHLAEPGGPRFVKGQPAVVRFELGGAGVDERRVVVWLPQTDTVEIRDVRADAPLQPAEPRDQLRWWHHGSSISHCIEATTPRGVWPVAVADLLDLDVTNLGFAANAHLDQFTARAMRDSGADLLSLKIGINIVGGDTMKRRTFVPAVHGFLDTIRDGAPATPILVISPIICPMHEETPGPTVTDPVTGERRGTPSEVPDFFEPPLTLRSVREILRDIVRARSAQDSALFFLEGLELLGEGDLGELPDGLHPSPAGYLLMAERFAGSPVVSEWIAAARPGAAPAVEAPERIGAGT